MKMQRLKNVLLRNKEIACGHTRGYFVPQPTGIWLIPVQIELSKLVLARLDYLESRNVRREECLTIADTITFACSNLSVTKPRNFSVKGFIHRCDKIGSSLFNKWLPMNHTPKLNTIKFEQVYPGPIPGHWQVVQRYRKHPKIQKFLAETSLGPSVDGKCLSSDFHC